MPQSETQTPNPNGATTLSPDEQEFVKLQKVEDRTVPKQLEYFKRLATTSDQALNLMQKERNALLVKLDVAHRQLQNAETAFTVQKNISRDSITGSNAELQSMGARIQELEAQVISQAKVIKELNGNKH